MKRFFNLNTCVMLAAIVIAMIVAVFSSTINWHAIIWMVIAAMWVFIARVNELTAEDWEEQYSGAVRELLKLRRKHQVLDNDYLKLAKQNEVTSKENVQLRKHVDDLRKQNSDYAEKCQTTAQDPDNATQKVEELTQTPEAKKPTQKVTKSEYSEQDQARIREEMKSAGMKPKAKKRRPVDDED